MRRSTTKSALLMSALSLFLCFAMLMGSTFAWFTDVAESAKNLITAGNLDVELYHSDKGTNGANEVVGDQTKLFDDVTSDKWEPGAMAYEVFTVENKGNLALRYAFTLNALNATVVNGKSFASMLKVAVVYSDSYNYTRENILADTTLVWKDLASFTLTDDLEAKATGATENPSDVFGIIIWWQPSEIDNLFNMNNDNSGKKVSVEVGVVLNATQLNSESDSIDKDYDADAMVNVFDANSLQVAINAGEKNITLENDITLDQPLVIPASVTTYSLRSAVQPTVINLNGKTISGSMNKSVGAVIKNEGYLVLKNGIVSSTGANGGSALVNNGTAVLENVTLNGAPNADGDWPSYALNNVGTLDATNIKVTSYHGAVCSYGEGAVVTLNSSEIDMAGIPGFTSHGIYTYNGGAVVVNGGTYANKATDQNATGASVINGAVTINGGTFTGRIENYYGTPVIKAGTFSADPDKYIASGCTATENTDGTYTVTMSKDTIKENLSNAQPGDTVVIPEGTYTFPASDLKEGVTLQCTPGTVFEGTSGLNINGSTVVGGTFSNTSGTAASGTINGTFKDCDFTGSNALRWCYTGDTVVFENCTFSGDVYGVHFDGGATEIVFINCTFSGFNALAGAIELATFEGCTFVANGKSSYNGINMWGSTEMTDCTFIFDGTANTEWVDACGDNETYKFTNCVVTDGKTEKGLETVVGNYGDGNTIIIDGAYVVSNNTDFTAAVAAGATTVKLRAGDYDLNGNQKDGLEIIGLEDGVNMANNTKYASGKAVGAIWQAITLENVTVTNTVYTMADGGNAVFTDVNFAAGFRQGYGKNVEFNNCVFGSNSEGYALHFQTDSSSEGGNITLNGCEFEGGKVHLGGKRAYTFTDCDFAEGTDFQVWSGITLENCTVNGVKVDAENLNTLFPNLNAEKVTLK